MLGTGKIACNHSLARRVVATLVSLTLVIEANAEKSFVIVLQNGGNDITCKRPNVSTNNNTVLNSVSRRR